MVKDITVVNTNYTDYALVLKHKVFNREYTQLALYGKKRTYTHFYITSKLVNYIVNIVHHCSICLLLLQVAL